MQEKVNLQNRVIKQIISVQKGEGTVDEDLLQVVSHKMSREDIHANDAFILGFIKYQEGDSETAKKYFEVANTSQNEMVRLYANVFLSEILLQQENYTELVTLIGETVVNCSEKTYNSEIDTLTDLTQNIIHLDGGKEVVIKSFEKVLEEVRELDIEVVCSLKNKIAVLYFHNGNYARAIEKLLEVMAHSEEMENKYYGAKAQIDLGVIYGGLGNYEEAKRNFKEALEIEISDLEDMAFIKTYASINLYENMLYEEDYEGIRELSKLVSTYIDYLPQDLYDSIVIINDIFLCKSYIQLGELEAAENLIQNIKQNLKKPEEYRYLGINTNYTLLQAELAIAKGDMETGINLYRELLSVDDKPFKKYILVKLIESLNAEGIYEEANQYEEELRNYYEEEAIAVNMDYSDYALYKYEHEKKLLEDARIEMQKYIYRIIVGIIVVGAIGIFYIKNKQLAQMNKLDGLVKVYNRRYFETYYRELQNKETPFAIIIFDIDHFKLINDLYGHLVGDQVIKNVAEISELVIGKKGKLFRYGGEEFVSIIEGASLEEVLQIAEGIRKNIEAYSWQQEMNVTVSIGVKQTAGEIRDILNQADQNLYLAKNNGRNQVIYN